MTAVILLERYRIPILLYMYMVVLYVIGAVLGEVFEDIAGAHQKNGILIGFFT